ncbi:MAG: hypothetical protein AABN33_27930 [Acidobacteriota bacterium]
MLSWLTSNAAALGVLSAAITFVWSAIQFILVRRKEQQAHEFQAFHRLIKELVSPDDTNKLTWIDRQMAVVFELRHFHRYCDVTFRILSGLREKWCADPESRWTRLIEEIDSTLEHISKQKPEVRLPLTPQ